MLDVFHQYLLRQISFGKVVRCPKMEIYSIKAIGSILLRNTTLVALLY